MSIPARFNRRNETAPTRGYEAADDGYRPRILLAEDDDDMRRMLVSALRKDAYEVIEARDGAELARLLAAESVRSVEGPPIDLVISDLRMPGRSGLEVLGRMRRSDWATPFILTTAFGDSETHAEARRLGAAAVFDKPFDLDDLRTVVCNLVA